jgi:hypothetical protein
MNSDQTTEEKVDRALPYTRWVPIAAGVVVGLVLSLIFVGKAGNAYSAMSGAFIYLAPPAMSVTTIYLAERIKRRSWGYYFRAAAMANFLMVIGTLIIMIEGIICAIIIIPLFMLYGGLCGIIMGAICRHTDWPKPAVYSIAVLPLLLGGFEQRLPLPIEIQTVEREQSVAATPEEIWCFLVDSRAIQPYEVDAGWMYKIGVPLPLEGVTESIDGVQTRHVRMGKAIHFDQVAAVWEPNRRVLWRYRFTQDSFPPNALDDHVVIGGQYFDLIDTDYSLAPEPDGTRLKVSMRYRVSTRFNWYAQPVAKALVANFETTILGFYARRAENLHAQEGSRVTSTTTPDRT